MLTKAAAACGEGRKTDEDPGGEDKYERRRTRGRGEDEGVAIGRRERPAAAPGVRRGGRALEDGE